MYAYDELCAHFLVTEAPGVGLYNICRQFTGTFIFNEINAGLFLRGFILCTLNADLSRHMSRPH